MPNLTLESQYPNKIIVGLDEVGRGALSGPVIVGAVIVDQNYIISGIKDSKKLSRASREALYKKIIKNYIWSIGVVSHEEIDRINILEATKTACLIAIGNLTIIPDIVLVDGNMKFPDPRFISIINGDNLSISIATASIVAKVIRDRLMAQYAKDFPQYLWNKNFGYGTKEHIDSIRNNGLSNYHRKSFKIKLLTSAFCSINEV